MSPVIDVSGLTKSYGPIRAVSGVSLSVAPGEVFGFLGPNGAGKSTTIRLLMQLLRPDAGRIALFGMTLARRHPEMLDRIGYLPGDFRPPQAMHSGAYLAYMSRYRGRPPRLRADLSRRLGFGEKEMNQRIRHLSHGNRQKLGLLLALEHEPELAILDEPTLGLDPLVQEAFYEVVRDLRDRGTTVFLSSHLLAEVEEVCSRVAIVRAGTVVAEESIETLKRRRPRRLLLVLSDGAAAPELPGTRLLEREGNRGTYLVTGDVRAAISAIPDAGIEEFYLPEPDLGDVFLAYYREGSR